MPFLVQDRKTDKYSTYSSVGRVVFLIQIRKNDFFNKHYDIRLSASGMFLLSRIRFEDETVGMNVHDKDTERK